MALQGGKRDSDFRCSPYGTTLSCANDRYTAEFWDLYRKQGQRQNQPYPRCDPRTGDGTHGGDFMLARTAYAESRDGQRLLTITVELGRSLKKALTTDAAELSCQVGGVPCEGGVEKCSLLNTTIEAWTEEYFNSTLPHLAHYQCVVREGSALAHAVSGDADASDSLPVWALVRRRRAEPWCSVLVHYPLRIIGPLQGPAIRPRKLGMCLTSVL
jgi:hypothetical protein